MYVIEIEVMKEENLRFLLRHVYIFIDLYVYMKRYFKKERKTKWR